MRKPPMQAMAKPSRNIPSPPEVPPTSLIERLSMSGSIALHVAVGNGEGAVGSGSVGIFVLASSRTAAQFSRGRDLPRHDFQGDPSLRLKSGSARMTPRFKISN